MCGGARDKAAVCTRPPPSTLNPQPSTLKPSIEMKESIVFVLFIVGSISNDLDGMSSHQDAKDREVSAQRLYKEHVATIAELQNLIGTLRSIEQV
jgi:hypothetical protein